MSYTFDGWDTPQDSLMHFRTKGSKNGIRRYQTKSGAWTPLGLAERKAREGWGNGGKKTRAEKRLARAERRISRRKAVADFKAARAEKKRKNSLKGLSDADLQKKINRLKMEEQYKELTKSPLLKAGEKLLTSYFNAKEKQLEREAKRAELVVRQQEARQKTLASKAALTQARNGLLDNVIRGSKYKQAQAQLITAKADKTIRGAMRKALGNVITKEGDRIVSEMGDQSLVMRGGRRVKSAISDRREKTVTTLKKAYAQDKQAAEEARRRKQKQRDRKAGQELRG